MAKAAKNILTLNHEEVMDFFMKSEHYHGFELPEYFTFDEVLKQENKKGKEDLASYFWKVAAKTPYFELLLQQMVEYTTTEAIKNVSFKTKLIRKLKPAVNLFFPLQTKRRETLKKLLGK